MLMVHLGYVRTYIVLPSTIWGIAKNPLVDAGIQHPYSQQIPALIRAALGRGQAGVLGKGQAYWPSVNIEERMCQDPCATPVRMYRANEKHRG